MSILDTNLVHVFSVDIFSQVERRTRCLFRRLVWKERPSGWLVIPIKCGTLLVQPTMLQKLCDVIGLKKMALGTKILTLELHLNIQSHK